MAAQRRAGGPVRAGRRRRLRRAKRIALIAGVVKARKARATRRRAAAITMAEAKMLEGAKRPRKARSR